MAQRRIVELIDDLDETIIEDGGTQTFALNGTSYEIDLSASNIAKLRDALAPFIEAGRRVRSTPSPRSRTGGAKDLDAIRAWARTHGFTISDRGRIAEHIVAAYEAR